MDCGITNCHNYGQNCFFQTILIRKPDPKTGCSYCREMKKKNASVEYDENGNKIRKTRADKGQKREKPEKKVKKRKKEENSLSEIM